MTEPKGWRIQADLEFALNSADGTGKYFHSLSVNGLDSYSNQLNALDCYIRTASITRVDGSEPPNRYEWEHTFSVIVSVPTGVDDAEDVERRRLRAFADVGRAVMADPHRNELAIDTEVTGYEPFDDGSGRDGIIATVSVRYRTAITDFTQD